MGDVSEERWIHAPDDQRQSILFAVGGGVAMAVLGVPILTATPSVAVPLGGLVGGVVGALRRDRSRHSGLREFGRAALVVSATFAATLVLFDVLAADPGLHDRLVARSTATAALSRVDLYLALGAVVAVPVAVGAYLGRLAMVLREWSPPEHDAE